MTKYLKKYDYVFNINNIMYIILYYNFNLIPLKD